MVIMVIHDDLVLLHSCISRLNFCTHYVSLDCSENPILTEFDQVCDQVSPNFWTLTLAILAGHKLAFPFVLVAFGIRSNRMLVSSAFLASAASTLTSFQQAIIPAPFRDTLDEVVAATHGLLDSSLQLSWTSGLCETHRKSGTIPYLLGFNSNCLPTQHHR